MVRSFALVAFFVLAFCFSSALARKAEYRLDTPIKPKHVESPKEKSRVDTPIYRKRVESPKTKEESRVDTPIYRKRAESPKTSPKNKEESRVDTPIYRKRAESPKTKEESRVDTPIYRKRAESPKESRVDKPILKPVDKPILKRKAPRIDAFTVVGKIYCDPCRFEFVSRLSKPLGGVKVSLTCRKADSNNATYVKEGKSDANGVYKIFVDGDHEDEICEVKPEATGKGTCTEFMTNKSDRIVLTNNMGSSSLVRLVNPLGFKTKTVDKQCHKVVKELGLDKLEA